ncbi:MULTISPECIES: CDP-diacylglycerol--serine O-phosphatidyltransferase [Alteromonas]|jgi:CDP-diacylglycerol--serine O-phosphatidyltransferase|uniref:CDP-diacylglycerol--serine O-phosphatidyltransferase n=1 Tax=Alteromonas stellipolaris TaxID=233316 RepID=A0AAW7Z1S2_9ALTE|nr:MULTISPECIES: CDP-diacylglycerol--serine O-phosphatidyltransferase [Alteromonas]AMJ91261.1 CDP-diacylglycerol--serine O-phosphatidyltransferase [Alteromonas sp. Mac2]ALM89948.1 CDP-diacylglycerol-serine O-phosphatidyltransferase [Alteromonas stellipolaris LMG 21856]AMJ74994.1 CDP-diacylglycerol--serine O-phosphatidyltransferase [Alteromonas stellipolaris]AMJ87399.1 CDP-diacylglycerol--serine O-phosphatidyltransferase [Alteromonas sp. Mac1]AMJ95146.1 CDP-diacylglycerol--serine O-phosphatidyl
MSEQKRKGIYLLPNLLTTAGLFSGFFAVVSSMTGRFEAAAVAIFVAMVFDGLDGRVARMTNTQSDFGAEYDSMADMVSFGMAPALVAYNWGLTELGKFGWLAAFVYVAGAALRLARFNTQVGIADKRFFQGLASPAAAAVVAGLVWVGVEYDAVGTDYGIIVALVTGFAGLLMVSNFKYNSFKELNWHGKVPFVGLLIVLLIFVVVATEPALVLFIVFSLYALAGPINTFRTVDKVTLNDVVGEQEEDADFNADANSANDTVDSSEGKQDEESSNKV